MDTTGTDITITTTTTGRKIDCYPGSNFGNLALTPASSCTYITSSAEGLDIGGNLSINTNATLDTTVDDEPITVGSWIDGNGTLEANASTITTGNGISCQFFNSSGGTLDIGNDFRPTLATFSGDTTLNCSAQVGGRIVVNGTNAPIINAGRIYSNLDIQDGDQGKSIFNLDLTEDQATSGSPNALFFYDLILDSSATENNTYTMKEAITVSNNLTITDGVIDTSSSDYALTVLGNFNLDSGGTLITNDSVTTIGGNWINNGGDVA